MKALKLPVLLFALSYALSACGRESPPSKSESRLVGGPCEGCEAIFEYGDRPFHPVDTLPGFHQSGQKIKVTGAVYENDGRTPAEGVILYVYHTNQDGIYPTRSGKRASGHGYIREWLQTGKDGRYTFYTLKPGSYPSGTEPAHIHLIVLEPDGKYYWLGSYHFAGDPLLTEAERHPKAPRAGSPGLLDLKKKGDLWVGQRDIVLGSNIPDYE